MFHDSKIASNYQMSYTKMQYILEFCIQPYILENICSDFRDTAFTFKFDETTNCQVKKQYDGHLQYYSKKFERVVNQYCGSPFIGHCNAEQLKDHFFDFGKKSNWNLNYVGKDGPNVNLKFEKDLVAELKQVHGKEILDIGTCSLHPVHTAYCKGLKSVGFDYDKFAQELHFFFKQSAARREDLEMPSLKTELEVRVMLRHVPSRWVSLKRCLVRIDGQWDHLREYILNFLPTQRNFKSDVELKESLINNFAICVADMMESFLISMQSSEPKIHMLYTGDLFYKLMSCFVKK